MRDAEKPFALVYPDAKHPERGTPKSAGADVFVYLPDEVHSVTIAPGESVMLGTGIRLREELREGYYIAMELRSHWRKKKCSSMGTGIIDGDYPDEINCFICNLSSVPVVITHGEAVAQFILKRHRTSEWGCAVRKAKRDGGWGSTGSGK